MKTEQILSIEESAENIINLVRDRLFWQAWNKSAFLFVSHFKKYQVHKRYVQKVSQEVAWLGFPRSALAEIERIAKVKGWSFDQRSADHITISGIPTTNGYERWWASIVKPVKPVPAINPATSAGAVSADTALLSSSSSKSKGPSQLLPAYKIAYDLCLNVHKATAKMPKEFRYELGARVRGYATDVAEKLHIICNVRESKSARAAYARAQAELRSDTIADCADMVHRLRIGIRILNDLRQIGINQWGFLNEQIEKLLDCLRAEFCKINHRFAGAALNQSSGAFPPAKVAGEHEAGRENFSYMGAELFAETASGIRAS